MQNIIWIILLHNLFLAANVCQYTVRYAVRLPNTRHKNGYLIFTKCENKLQEIYSELCRSNPVEFISSPIATTSIWIIIQEKAKIYFACNVLNNASI